MKCRLCHSENLRFYYSQGSNDEFKLYKCNKCGLVNLDLSTTENLIENQEKYAEIYKEPFSKKGNIGSYNSYKFIKSKLKSKGKFLDIGCGNGALLNLAKEDSWDVKGLELSDYLAEKIKNTLEINVEVGDFLSFDSDSSGEKYDLVALRHVLEHLPDSILALTKINRLLKNGGFSLFEFPNIEAWSFKFKRFLANKGIKKKIYSEDWVPGHCNEFSIKTWKYLLNQTGFKLVSWETYSNKPLNNAFYKLFNIGNKARTLVKKIKDV